MGHRCYFCFLYKGKLFAWYSHWGGPHCWIGKKFVAELNAFNKLDLYGKLWLPFIKYIYHVTYPGVLFYHIACDDDILW